MGSVFRQTYTVAGPNGTRVTRESKKWYVEYIDGSGKRARQPGFTDRRKTEQLLVKLEGEAELVRLGLRSPQSPLIRQPLADHLAAHLEHMAAKNDTAEHIALVRMRCTTILAGCKFNRWIDLEPTKVEVFLASLRSRAKRPLAIQTTNDYLQQFRTFVTWLARKLKADDPLTDAVKLNAEVDRRHVRRVIPPEEFARLIDAAEAGKVWFRQSGPARALLYLVAAYTGFRASELASLTPQRFVLDAQPPRIILQAKIGKNRKQAFQPLTPALALRLRTFIARLAPDARLWPGCWAETKNASRMLQGDLVRAQIPYRDAVGEVFDFHALRSQFVTALAVAGVPLVEAQRLARHSDPRLTANVYSRLNLGDLAAGLAMLPEMPKPKDPAA